MSTIFEALNNSSLISEISAIPDLSARNLTENVEGMMNCGVEMQMSFTGGYKATFLFQS